MKKEIYNNNNNTLGVVSNILSIMSNIDFFYLLFSEIHLLQMHLDNILQLQCNLQVYIQEVLMPFHVAPTISFFFFFFFFFFKKIKKLNLKKKKKKKKERKKENPRI